MLAWIDYWLDRITMYRLVLYYLIAIILMAIGLGAFGLLAYTPLQILYSTALALVVCFVTNLIFSKVFEAPANTESVYITALIIVCLVTPIRSIHNIPLVFWASVLAMASKYILAIRNKHIFNPAAIAVVLTGFWLNLPATWWVGTINMLPVVILGGLLVIQKIRRIDMILVFFVVAVAAASLFAAVNHVDVLRTIQQLAVGTPLFFFGFVMVTEPLTSPVTNSLQMWFAALVGVLAAPQVHVGTIYSTPELALVIGNVFAFLVTPKVKERLRLREIREAAANVFEFIFEPSRQFAFVPGQYMEFTLPHTKVDSRGNRRYFTIASSPTEDTVRLGVKFYPESSSFKHHFGDLKPNDAVMGGQLAGDFTLPKNPQEKVVFLAGGIGVTPFRSMLKYMTDTNQTRPTTLLYMNKTADEIAYRDIFDTAAATIGTKVVYVLTDAWPEGWTGRTGFVNAQMIQEEVPDYMERTFYLSGPHGMVVAMEKALLQLGVPAKRIKKDFFPGLV